MLYRDIQVDGSAHGGVKRARMYMTGLGVYELMINGEKAGDGTNKRKSAKDLLSSVDKTKPVLVLQHEPIEFKNLAESGADVVMCGHTHNGQIFPGNLVIPFFNENAYGVKKLYGIDTIVTAGVGHYGPPIRVGTNSEVTVINIKFD